MTRVQVKICGLTRPADADSVNGFRPDCIGLVFAPGRRTLGVRAAADIAGRLSPGIRKVGVFADGPLSMIAGCISACGLDVVQLHGGETPDDVHRLRMALSASGFADVRIWKAFGIPSGGVRKETAERNLEGIDRFSGRIDAVVLDAAAPSEGQAGGNGLRPDWETAWRIRCGCRIPVVLAGGLDAGNVTDAIRKVGPYAVDVSSGVETDGIKDPDKMASFVTIARGVPDSGGREVYRMEEKKHG